MSWPRAHVCGKYKGTLAIARAVCSFCVAKAVSPGRRSGAMKMIIAGEKLQLEVLELLHTICPCSSAAADKAATLNVQPA